MHRVITNIHNARPSQTDRQTDGQTPWE